MMIVCRVVDEVHCMKKVEYCSDEKKTALMQSEVASNAGVHASTAAANFGGSLLTSGSFTMMSSSGIGI